ncbi:ABC transporter family substrate-binding protein [Modestobacter sp. VKM Ac-2986]|uniref:ABC transporter family substrate-binding protein n=1 Tax=Modestobacter sp. VKM Ac-2986 TaxID=3004140 RepID=UPI0022ABB999|nr:ABC transporter family substrate-binding protein [Modestobacter sp. VKM Ac-2986]MCZ2830370.1 ABC transporter family substrate-binding protein [Modestobacter sp. VKM Ac-2986]
MKLSKRSAALIATGVTGAMALTACGGGSDSEGGGGEATGGSGRVVFGESTDFPENLFPLISAGNATSVANISAQLLPSTFDVQPDFSVTYNEDLLVSEPTLSTEGGTQVNVYEIKPEAVWSDGTPITAEDFEFSWNMQKNSDPATGGCADLLGTTGYDQVASVEGSGEGNKTVTVTYTTPYSDWQSMWAGASNPVFPSHLMAHSTPEELCQTVSTGWPIAEGLPSDVSGGPWQLKKENINVGQQTVTLTPNAEWWGEPAGLQALVIQNIGNDPTTAVQGLSNGEIGVIYPQPQLDLVEQIEGLEPNVTSDVTFGLSFEHLDFNTLDPHLADLAVRQAFTRALDRQQIVDQTVGQFSDDAEVLGNRIYFNNQPQYQDTTPAEYKTQDTAGAKELLEGAGYTLGADGVYTHPQRGRLSIKIDTTVNNPLRQTTIEVMIPQLKAAGIEASFNGNPDIFKGPETPTSLVGGGFQAAVFAWVGSPFRGATQSIYETPAAPDSVGQNYSRQGTPEIDALFAQFQTEPDPDAQAELGNQIDALLWGQVATVPLYQKPTFIAHQSNIQGVEDNSTQSGPLWNSSTWTVQ